MEVGLRAFYDRYVDKSIAFAVFERFAARLSRQKREVLAVYSPEDNDYETAGERLYMDPALVYSIMRTIRTRWNWVEKNILKGCGEYTWLTRPGIGGYRIQKFPTLSGAEFAKVWNTLPRDGRIALVNISIGASFAEIGRVLGVPHQTAQKVCNDAEWQLYAVAEPNCLKYHLSAHISNALAGRGIQTREDLESYLSSGGKLDNIPTIGEKSAWEIFAYLGYPLTNPAGEFEYVPLSVQNALTGAGIVTVEDLKRFCKNGFNLRCLKGISQLAESKLLKYITR